jgi:hypothetical protein
MEAEAAALESGRLNICSPDQDSDMVWTRRQMRWPLVVASEDDLAALIGRLGGAAAPRETVMDFVAHAAEPRRLLRFGSWELADTPAVRAFFAARRRVLVETLRVVTLRLVGCYTAETDDGRAIIAALAEILGVTVLGTDNVPDYTDYADPDGLGFPLRSGMLVNPAQSPERAQRTPTVKPR